VHDGTPFAEPLCRVFVEECGRIGVDVGAVAGVTRIDERHFRETAAVVAACAPDAVLIAGLEEPCRSAAFALREAGVTAVFLGTDAIKPTKVLLTPAAAVAGPFLTNSGTDARHQAPDFHVRFEARFGRHDSVYTVEAYDAARLLIGLMRSLPVPERGQVLPALGSLPGYSGVGGLVRFDARGERVDPAIGIYRHDDGKLRYLGTHREVLAAAVPTA
jgi:branched-chain amino acid transport system substrate-binding protein